VKANPILKALTLWLLRDKIPREGAITAIYEVALNVLKKQPDINEMDGYIIVAGPLDAEMLHSARVLLASRLPESISLIGVNLPTVGAIYYGGSLLARKDGNLLPNLESLYGQQGMNAYLKQGEQWLDELRKANNTF
jgi:hypothetical protein